MNGGERIGPVNAEAARPNLTPTPVPSEADPGTGEHRCSPNRCCNECGRHLTPHVMTFAADMAPIPCDTPATPDAGDVEALLRRHGGYKPAPLGQGWRCWCDADLRPFWPTGGVTPRDTAINAALRGHLAVVLASHDAATADRVRRETAEGIAAAINQAARRTFTNEQEAAMRDAARIAREAGR